MFSMVMVRVMEKLPYFNYSFTGNVSCYNPTLFVDDDVCSRCGREGCECDPDTCDCEPTPKQKDLVQDFEEQKGISEMMKKKTKGYAKGGMAKNKKTKGYAKGGAVKAKKMMGGGMAKKKTKAYAKGGKVGMKKTKGYAKGGAVKRKR